MNRCERKCEVQGVGRGKLGKKSRMDGNFGFRCRILSWYGSHGGLFFFLSFLLVVGNTLLWNGFGRCMELSSILLPQREDPYLFFSPFFTPPTWFPHYANNERFIGFFSPPS